MLESANLPGFYKKWILYSILSLFILLALTPTAVHAQPIASCDPRSDEPHPLRPYPGEICGPEATRTIDQTDRAYCAYRPWAVWDNSYMRNFEDCHLYDEWNDETPCILRTRSGEYSIALNNENYELPLVSVTRDGSDLTFFNRAQQHLADYLEGRAYYDRVAEPTPDDPEDRAYLWNRTGVFRKLFSNLPRNEGTASQNSLKTALIESAGTDVHDYIVSYVSGGEPSDWGVGTPMRLSDFLGHYPPDYTVYGCFDIESSEIRRLCNREYLEDLNQWSESIYGRLWPYVPMFTREDAIGFVQINPEPLQWFGGLIVEEEISMTNQVSIPHLPRLNQVSDLLRRSLASLVQEIREVNCIPDLPVPDTCLYDAGMIEEFALNWIGGIEGNQVQRCLGDTVNRVQADGFNLQLATAIWVYESNASNYNVSGLDFGINLPSIFYNFDAQITRLLELPEFYRIDPRFSSCFGSDRPNWPGAGRPMTDVEVFLLIFNTGGCTSRGQGTWYIGEIRNLLWGGIGSCPFPTTLAGL